MSVYPTIDEAWAHFTPLDIERPAETVIVNHVDGLSFLHWDPETREFEAQTGAVRIKIPASHLRAYERESA